MSSKDKEIEEQLIDMATGKAEDDIAQAKLDVESEKFWDAYEASYWKRLDEEFWSELDKEREDGLGPFPVYPLLKCTGRLVENHGYCDWEYDYDEGF